MLLEVKNEKLRTACWPYCKKDDIGKNSFRGVFEEASSSGVKDDWREVGS